MRIVAALAMLVKHLPPELWQAARPSAGGGPAPRWLALARAPAPIWPLSRGNAFHPAFYRGLTPLCMEGYDPVHIAVISSRTRRK